MNFPPVPPAPVNAHFEPSHLEVEPWAREHYAPLKLASGGRDATLRTTLCDIGLFAQFFRAAYGREATFADLSDALADLFFVWHRARPRCKSVATANRSRASLCSVWREAARNDMCHAPRHTKPRRVDRSKPRCWNADEVGRLLGAALTSDLHWYRPRCGLTAATWNAPPVDAGLWMFAVIITVYYTGLRISALLNTPAANLDLARGEIMVPALVQKHHCDQTFMLHEDVVAVWRRLDIHGRGIALVGSDWPYDKHCNSRWNTLNRWLVRLLHAAELVPPKHDCRKEQWHKLRRTFATHIAVEHGIEGARRLLGHSTLSVTLRYIDDRFLEGIDPSKTMPRPIIPNQQVLSIAAYREQQAS